MFGGQEGDYMADEFAESRAESRDMRERFMRAAYHHRRLPLSIADKDDIMRDLGLDPAPTDPYDVHDGNLYAEIASYWEQWGCVEGFANGYGRIKVTARGIQYIEGDLEQQPAPSNVTFHVGNAYGSIFGTQQHAKMNNVSFDFSTVEAELDRAEEEVDQRGGHDAAELKELIAEVRALHERGEPLDKGRLAKYLGVIQRNGWIAGPIAGTLLSIATGA
jgi:hypothetical protein